MQAEKIVIIKIRAEINETGKRKTTEKINKNQKLVTSSQINQKERQRQSQRDRKIKKEKAQINEGS